MIWLCRPQRSASRWDFHCLGTWLHVCWPTGSVVWWEKADGFCWTWKNLPGGKNNYLNAWIPPMPVTRAGLRQYSQKTKFVFGVPSDFSILCHLTLWKSAFKRKKIKEYIFIHYSYWVLPEETGCLEFTSTFDPERSSLTTELVIPYPFVRKATRNSMGECTLHILPQKYSQARLEVLTNIPILKVRKQSSERIDALTKVHTARKW